jgi:gliding motility-associated-like protein
MLCIRFKKYLPFFLILLSLNLAHAQLGKGAWHWQFGDSSYIYFSSGVPIAGRSSINVYEGCASVSDRTTGQLLFYTDGTNAWDRNNNQMPNGFGMIGGSGTSTQAAVIVPKPGNTNIYYLISCDCGGYCGRPNQGVNYSIVDMSLNGGLGDVVPGSKNISLTPPPTTEKLTAVKHCNGIDYWIIDHAFGSNSFNVYLVTSTGINTTPVVSSVGTIEQNTSGTFYESIGYLKASPNAKKLALGIIKYTPILEIYDFDNSSGIISNPITINYSQYGAYGVAFSPDNSKLYASSVGNGNNLAQYDLSSGVPSAIIASQTYFNAFEASALQLAPDGKIYASVAGATRTLAVINNPNNLGTSCNFSMAGPILPWNSDCILGLPNFIDADTITPISNSIKNALCSFNSYTLNANGNSNYLWSTGDTTQNISIKTFGNYWVSYFNSQGCKEIDTFHVTQTQPPIINILKDTFLCTNTPIPVTFNATDTNAVSYLWSDGFSNPIHTISSSGNYWVNYSFSNLCVSKDSFNFNEYPYPAPINLGDDTTFCLGKKELNAYTPNCLYLWSTGATSSSITATISGNYWVQVNYNGCKTTDSLTIYPEYSMFNFTMPNIITPNNDNINDYIDFSLYQFSSLQLEIYNRWGSKVYESTNPTCIWKPTEDDGTYYYVAQYTINCGTETQNKTLKGFITIIR